MLVKVSLTQAG